MHLLENIVYCVNGKIFASILNDVFDVDDVNESDDLICVTLVIVVDARGM